MLNPHATQMLEAHFSLYWGGGCSTLEVFLNFWLGLYFKMDLLSIDHSMDLIEFAVI